MIYKSSKIASKSPSKCLKPVSNPYMMFKHDVAHFSKNRKNSIFEKKFRACINKIFKMLIFLPNIDKIRLQEQLTHLSPPQKKSFMFVRCFSNSSENSILVGHFRQNPIFHFQVVLDTKRHQKSKKNFDFQILQDLSFLWI